MTIYETIIHMLTMAADNVVDVRAIELEKRFYDQFVEQLANGVGWYQREYDPPSVSIYGPMGPVTIRSGA